MKIIIPYDPDQFFNLEEQSLLQALGLEDGHVINQALDHWTTYAHGSLEDIYERTVDDVFEFIEVHFGNDHSCFQLAHNVLSANTDEIVELVKMTAMRLHQLIADLPHDINQRGIDSEEYHFLKVESFNAAGKYAVLTTDVIDRYG